MTQGGMNYVIDFVIDTLDNSTQILLHSHTHTRAGRQGLDNTACWTLFRIFRFSFGFHCSLDCCIADVCSKFLNRAFGVFRPTFELFPLAVLSSPPHTPAAIPSLPVYWKAGGIINGSLPAGRRQQWEEE